MEKLWLLPLKGFVMFCLCALRKKKRSGWIITKDDILGVIFLRLSYTVIQFASLIDILFCCAASDESSKIRLLKKACQFFRPSETSRIQASCSSPDATTPSSRPTWSSPSVVSSSSKRKSQRFRCNRGRRSQTTFRVSKKKSFATWALRRIRLQEWLVFIPIEFATKGYIIYQEYVCILDFYQWQISTYKYHSVFFVTKF